MRMRTSCGVLDFGAYASGWRSKIEILQMCSRAAWLEHGQIRQEGPVAEVVDAYCRSAWRDGPLSLQGKNQAAGDIARIPDQQTGHGDKRKPT